MGNKTDHGTQKIPLDSIRPNPQNPRESFRDDRIDELATSIEEQGLLQPVSVRPDSGEYELIHGERRYRAVSQLGWETIPAQIRDLSEREALEVSITENLQREDVSPLAEARSYQTLIDEFGLTQTEAADRLGKSQSHISNRLQLLDLPGRLKESILHQIFTPWQAREIDRVWGDYWIYDLAIDWDLSVSELREIVDDLQSGEPTVSVGVTWSKKTLDHFWEMDSGADHRTRVNHGTNERGEPMVQLLPSGIFDTHGRPVEELEGGVTHGLLWADRTLDTFSAEIDEYDEYELRPIKIDWPQQTIIPGFGYHRLRLAEIFDYTGEFEVELHYPPEIFEWGRRVGGDDA